MNKINHPEFIIIHHSYSPDNKKINDWAAIKKYHMSYRYNHETIPAVQAKPLISAGFKVEPPWIDIGYHYGIEYDNGYIVVRKGRDELTPGAHCVESKMNYRSIGICVVGRYDNQSINDEQMGKLVDLCVEICRRYRIPVENIRPHREYNKSKTCPGTAFPMDELREKVREALK
jgi:hypothetical protein